MESPESPNKNREEEVDELDDEYDSEEGEHDPNVFKIRGQLKQAAAKIYSTRELHSISSSFYFRDQNITRPSISTHT